MEMGGLIIINNSKKDEECISLGFLEDLEHRIFLFSRKRRFFYFPEIKNIVLFYFPERMSIAIFLKKTLCKTLIFCYNSSVGVGYQKIPVSIPPFHKYQKT
jgi:hypothetical protein